MLTAIETLPTAPHPIPGNRFIRKTHVGRRWVSTCYGYYVIGCDQQWGYETMAFYTGGKEPEQYRTLDEAEARVYHQMVVDKWLSQSTPDVPLPD